LFGFASLHILANYFQPLSGALVFSKYQRCLKGFEAMYKIVILLLILSCTSCVVLPEKDHTQKYQCALSTDMKVLKLVNLTDGDTSFYEWNDEMLAIITIPTSAIVSGAYVLVNNIYHIGEKQIKCN